MKTALALSLFAVGLAALLVFSQAGDDRRWETLRVYALAGGADAASVAVAVPAGWKELGQVSTVGSSLRFADESGTEIAIPRTALERAAAENRVLRPEPTEILALAARARK